MNVMKTKMVYVDLLRRMDIKVIVCLVIVMAYPVISTNYVDMKIVDEPSTFGFHYSYQKSEEEEKLKLRVQPANFSGPLHFKRLIGRCFNTIIKDYKYNFCPFSNITQHEQNAQWNPYRGVLGVWQEWEVSNNTYKAMLMKDGDGCGDIYRSVKVIFVCGNHSKIMNATEPERCSYMLIFMTPLVCDEDSMLVYPSLTPTLRHEWDLLETEKAAGDLTDKGYKRGLIDIFEKAGIYLNQAKYKVLVKQEQEKVLKQDGDFDSLMTCNAAYNLLKESNEALKQQLYNNTGHLH